MLYFITRPLARIGLALSYRKIHFHNKSLIPKDKPVLLAANHPTAFIEPCLLACFQHRDLFFMVRGDLFVKPFYIKLLNGLHMVPIFRLKDGGYKKLKNNYDTFEFCYRKLNERETIMILAEGRTIHEKRLRSIQKGTARIAFGSFEKHGDLDVHIVPVGVNYTYAERFRGDVMIECGQPILLKDYLDQYAEHPNQAINALTDELENRLKDIVIIIDRKEDEELVEQLFVLNRNNNYQGPLPVVVENNQQLSVEKRIADRVNALSEEEKKDWKASLKAYFSQLKKYGLKDQGVAQPEHYSTFNSMQLLFGFIPYTIGLIGHMLPMMLPKYISEKKVKAIEFKMSVRLGASLGTFLLYYAFLLFIVLQINSPWAWAALVALPFFGYYSILYQEMHKRWTMSRQFTNQPPKVAEELLRQRQTLQAYLPPYSSEAASLPASEAGSSKAST